MISEDGYRPMADESPATFSVPVILCLQSEVVFNPISVDAALPLLLAQSVR